MAAAPSTLPTTWSSSGVINPVSFNCSRPAAGIELDRQVDELEHDHRREKQDPHPHQRHGLEDDTGQERRERDVRSNAGQRHDQVANHEEWVVAGVLNSMSCLVSGDTHGGQRAVLVVGRR